MFTFPVGFFGGVQTIDPFWGNVVLYLPLTGSNGQTTFLDVSQYSYAVTRNGDAVVSTAQFPLLTGVNSSAYFDGNGDYLSINSASAVTGTQDYTVDLFFRLNTVNSSYSTLYGGTTTGSLLIGVRDMNRITVNSYGSPGFEFTTALSSSTWYFLTVKRTSGTTEALIDGVSLGTTTNSMNFFANTVTIASAGSIQVINAYISHLRVTRGVSRPYQSTPTAPFPIG